MPARSEKKRRRRKGTKLEKAPHGISGVRQCRRGRGRDGEEANGERIGELYLERERESEETMKKGEDEDEDEYEDEDEESRVT
ncbi:hypothetical protein NL676_017288 [Syzygium grande]|nr:hypothetical protein NL676_017288 [Syzygium grande]